MHEPFRELAGSAIESQFDAVPTPPNQLRWDPLPMPSTPTDFIDGLVTMAGNGDPAAMSGCAIHVYAANRSMTDRFFYDADGELLIVPQQGRLRLCTELGRLDVEPQEIAVHSARPALSRRAPGWRSGRLRLRKLRRASAPARSGADRIERPGQPARFPRSARMVRGP